MPTAAASTATKKVLDFTNVKESSGINPKHRPAGDYRVKITKVTEDKSKAGNDQWVFVMVPTDMLSAAYPYYCTLNAESLWKVRNLLIAAGVTVPKKKVNVDPNKLVGREIGVTLDDDEYEGKMKSVITAVFPAEDLDDDGTPSADDEDEVEEDVEEEVEEIEEVEEPVAKPTAKKKVAAKRKPAPEPEEDEVSEEDMDELEVEDL
jgi:hypothetical protein